MPKVQNWREQAKQERVNVHDIMAHHDEEREQCKKCNKTYCPGCITFNMAKRDGLCLDCAEREYMNELYADAYKNTTKPAYRP